MDVARFYDDYATRQLRTGINDRHRSILRLLQRYGFSSGQRVLEIGCGIGTLTELLLAQVGRTGELVATDVSPKSIEIAHQRLGHPPQLQLIPGDVLALDFDGEFDVVVLPDVIEHIPLELHDTLFARLAGWVRDDGFVLLHYPDPHHLEWVAANQPEVLQIIDQPIHAGTVIANADANGLFLTNYERYSIWHQPADYVVAVLRPVSGIPPFTHLPDPSPSVTGRVREKMQVVVESRRRLRRSPHV